MEQWLRHPAALVPRLGLIAAEGRVGMLVLSHLIPDEDPAVRDEMWISAARRHFDGRVVVAKDLMEL
jgi:ribonuclease BN (tRNA processing enzyme)